MKIIKRIGAVLVGLLLSVVTVVAGTTAAEASGGPPYFYDECNSSGSDSGIRSYNVNNGAIGNALNVGQCRHNLGGPDMIFVPEVRVDVNPELWFGSSNDIDSYMIGHINYGYRDCHPDSENADSNPDDDWADTGFRYKNFTGSNC